MIGTAVTDFDTIHCQLTSSGRGTSMFYYVSVILIRWYKRIQTPDIQQLNIPKISLAERYCNKKVIDNVFTAFVKEKHKK